MKKLTMLALAFAIVGCSGDTPLGTQNTDGDRPDALSELIAPAPRSVPFHASEQNTIEVVPPFLCLPPDLGVTCDELNPIIHAIFPGVIEGTHIGAGTIHSTSQIDFSVFPFAQTTQAVITSEDGDELNLDLVGTAVPGPNEGDIIFSGDFTFTGGTGHFSSASGGGTYAGTANTIAAMGQFDLDGVISK